jgi:hypothetical protein
MTEVDVSTVGVPKTVTGEKVRPAKVARKADAELKGLASMRHETWRKQRTWIAPVHDDAVAIPNMEL